jgi:hypothetical protein
MKMILISFSELLPGIEDFLCKTLAGENLSESAEQQRQYFVERAVFFISLSINICGKNNHIFISIFFDTNVHQ